MRTVILLLGVMAALLISASCSSSSGKELTIPAYFQSLSIVMRDTTEGGTFLNEPGNREAIFKDLEKTRDLLDRAASLFADSAAKLSRLNAPTALDVPHAKLISAAQRILADYHETQAAISTMKTDEELQAWVAANPSLPDSAQASKQFR